MKIHRTRISHPEVPKPVHLMANLAYRYQEHHQRNQYLWARIDTKVLRIPPVKLETDAAEIETTLNQIASGLQSAMEGYLALASHLPN